MIAPIPAPIVTPRSTDPVQRRSRWIARRAHNVARQPIFLGVLAGIVFLVLLVALIVIPVGARRAARAVRPKPGERPDTVPMAAAVRRAMARVRDAAIALDTERTAVLRATAPPPPVDTFPPALRARRDTLALLSGSLLALLRRAADAPLSASYRALGEHPAMRQDPHVRVLLDTLADVERSRSASAVVGGVDPIFVALTTRANVIGQELQEIARRRRAELRHEIATLTPPPVPPRDTAALAVDTLRLVAARDSAAILLRAATGRLASARTLLQALDEREARARQLAALGASPLQMLGAAAVLGIAVGFLLALLYEVRRPRVGDAYEAETVAGAPVLIRVEPAEASGQRSRRRADRDVPRLIELSSDRYARLYFQLADTIAKLPRMAVVGDDAATVATVAANLAAAAAHTARNVLLVDTDFDTRTAAAVLNVRGVPGLAEVLARRAGWTDVLSAALVGRERIVDVLSAGVMKGGATLAGAVGTFRAEIDRLARRYDTIIASAPLSQRGTVSAVAAAIGEAVMVARVGRTPIRTLERLAYETRDAGARIRGVVLWETDDPSPQAPLDRPSTAAREPWGRTAAVEMMTREG